MAKQRRAKPFAPAKPLPSKVKGYKVRESRRAKHVSIKVSNWGEVEVVVPPGFSVDKLTRILEQRKGWIQKTKAKIQAERQATAHETEPSRPTEIILRAVDEVWTVSYQATDADNVAVDVDLEQHHLRVTGQIDQVSLCHQLLGQWVRDYARYRLTAWIREVSDHVQLPFNRLTIRRQKTRWASCSSDRNINLNDKLMFIPKELVHYVFVHELCHTIHLNHSSQFWDLVGQKEPHYKPLDKELRTAWRYVPRWLVS